MLTACPAAPDCDAGGLNDRFHATGSRSAVSSQDQRFVYVVNADHGALSRVDRLNGSQDMIDVGVEPSRVAVAGDRVLVSLRGERGLALFRETGQTLELVKKVTVGAEPMGLVVTEDGNKFYIASSQSGVVEERDPATLAVLRTWHVADEPRWLALHPTGNTLFVAAAMNGRIQAIDLLGEQEIVQIGLPRIQGIEGNDRHARITGDIAVDADGQRLMIPTFYVDSDRPVPNNPHGDGGDDIREPDCEGGCGDSGDDYGSTVNPRFVPALVSVPLTATGRPESSDAQVAELSGTPRVSNDDFFAPTLKGFPTGVTASPDGDLALVSMESANAVLAVPLSTFPSNRCVFGTPRTTRDQDGNVTMDLEDFVRERPRFLTIHVGEGPQSVAFNEAGEAVVHTRFDNGLSTIDVDRVLKNLTESGGMAPNSSRRLVPATVRLASQALPDDQDRGRRLFFTAVDATVSAPGSGVSCSACHFDGRNDGLTWQFDDGRGRSTPSLAGDVSRTEPISWFDNVPTVADEIRATSQNRMGGTEIREDAISAIAAFVNGTREVDTVNRGQESELIGLGRELFFDANTGCADCHWSDEHPGVYTDNEIHQVFGNAVRTRSLNGIAASAPYFHDGSAKTLYEVLDRSQDGSMGFTGDLSDHERDALVAFLKSL